MPTDTLEVAHLGMQAGCSGTPRPADVCGQAGRAGDAGVGEHAGS